MLGKIVADRRDRMGSRLTVLANALRISQDYDLPFAIYWSVDNSITPELSSPETLFSSEFINKYFLPKEEWLPRVKAATSLTPPFQGLSSANDLRRRIHSGEYFLCGNPFGVVTLPWEDPIKTACHFKAVLDTIPYSEIVTKHMQAIKAKLKGNPTTAYHLRRGDIITSRSQINKSWPQKYVPTVFYESLMETEFIQSPKTNIVVFSDTEQELKNLSKRFPVQTFNDLVKTDELNLGQRDFLELYAMSQCAKISAPKKSGFSSMAIEFGGAERVTIPQDLSAPRRAEAYGELIRRLEDEPEYFLNHADLGQSLFHAISYLQSHGQIEKASTLLEKHVRAGVNIAYLYSLLANCKLSLKQDAELCELHQSIFSKRTILSYEEWSAVQIQTAIAEYRLGNTEAVRLLAVNGVWHAPHNLAVNQAIGFFISKGIFTPDNFFPFDPVLHADEPLSGSNLKSYVQHLPRVKGDDFPIFNGDLLTRDWNGKLTMRLRRNHNVIEIIREKINGLQSCLGRDANLDISLMSSMSVYHRVAHDTGLSLALAETVADEMPENALFAKRLGDAFDANKDKKNSLLYARKAASLSGEHPCYLVDLALRLYKYRQKVRAANTIERALIRAKEIGFTYPDILHAYVVIMREVKRPEELLVEITSCMKSTPPNCH